jgi:hypothetical protein
MNPTPTAAQLQEAHAIINRVGVSTEDVVARVALIIAEVRREKSRS